MPQEFDDYDQEPSFFQKAGSFLWTALKTIAVVAAVAALVITGLALFNKDVFNWVDGLTRGHKKDAGGKVITDLDGKPIVTDEPGWGAAFVNKLQKAFGREETPVQPPKPIPTTAERALDAVGDAAKGMVGGVAAGAGYLYGGVAGATFMGNALNKIRHPIKGKLFGPEAKFGRASTGPIRLTKNAAGIATGTVNAFTDGMPEERNIPAHNNVVDEKPRGATWKGVDAYKEGKGFQFFDNEASARNSGYTPTHDVYETGKGSKAQRSYVEIEPGTYSNRRDNTQRFVAGAASNVRERVDRAAGVLFNRHSAANEPTARQYVDDYLNWAKDEAKAGRPVAAAEAMMKDGALKKAVIAESAKAITEHLANGGTLNDLPYETVSKTADATVAARKAAAIATPAPAPKAAIATDTPERVIRHEAGRETPELPQNLRNTTAAKNAFFGQFMEGADGTPHRLPDSVKPAATPVDGNLALKPQSLPNAKNTGATARPPLNFVPAPEGFVPAGGPVTTSYEHVGGPDVVAKLGDLPEAPTPQGFTPKSGTIMGAATLLPTAMVLANPNASTSDKTIAAGTGGLSLGAIGADMAGFTKTANTLGGIAGGVTAPLAFNAAINDVKEGRYDHAAINASIGTGGATVGTGVAAKGVQAMATRVGAQGLAEGAAVAAGVTTKLGTKLLLGASVVGNVYMAGETGYMMWSADKAIRSANNSLEQIRDGGGNFDQALRTNKDKLKNYGVAVDAPDAPGGVAYDLSTPEKIQATENVLKYELEKAQRALADHGGSSWMPGGLAHAISRLVYSKESDEAYMAAHVPEVMYQGALKELDIIKKATLQSGSEIYTGSNHGLPSVAQTSDKAPGKS